MAQKKIMTSLALSLGSFPLQKSQAECFGKIFHTNLVKKTRYHKLLLTGTDTVSMKVNDYTTMTLPMFNKLRTVPESACTTVGNGS